MRPAPAAACALVAVLFAGGCGGVRAADLFLVQRSGPTPHARLTVLVNEEGGVRCNGGPRRQLGDPQIVKARAIQEELHDAAARKLALAARPDSVYAYRVRDVDGTVTFADNSAGQPKVLHELALFVLQTAQQVCGLPE